MTHPVISVCIANFNGEDFICECIDSVLNQDTKLDIEIIVHDDASTDNSITLIRSRYPQVKLIESKTNSGFCKSNNKMANIARGEYLLLLNNDAQLFPDALQALHEVEEDVGAGVAFDICEIVADLHTFAIVDEG